MDYLIELRSRLLRCLIIIGLLGLILLPFSNLIYNFLAKPLLQQLPHNSHLIATALPAAFFVPLKFTFFVAIIFSMPFMLYQFWGFIAPALYKQEKFNVWFILFFSTFLFFCGLAFAYKIIFPLIFKFFIQTAPMGVTVMPDISQYLDLAGQLFLAFGLAFEIPMVILVLVILGIASPEQIAHQRRYFIVLAFVFAMLITPPDVLSQSLLAVPMCLLFEFGLLLAKAFRSKSVSEQNAKVVS